MRQVASARNREILSGKLSIKNREPKLPVIGAK